MLLPITEFPFLMAEQCFIVCMSYIFIICLFVSSHLVSFHIFPVVNSAAMNIGVLIICDPHFSYFG